MQIIKSDDSEGWVTPAQQAGTHCHILHLHSSCNPDSTSDPAGPSGIQCQYAQVVDKGFRKYVPWPLCPIAVVARLHMPGIDLSSHNS